MKITPLDIQQQKFKIKLRGFDVQEVDGFLEEVAGAMTAVIHENEELRERIRRLDLENRSLKKQDETFKRVMLSSHKVIEQMKDNTKKSGELIIADAEVKAEKILSGAHNRLAQLHEDIQELKRQRMQIVLQIRSILESHTKLLEINNEESTTSDATDSKVQFLKTR
jgi:cell division initiation protein